MRKRREGTIRYRKEENWGLPRKDDLAIGADWFLRYNKKERERRSIK